MGRAWAGERGEECGRGDEWGGGGGDEEVDVGKGMMVEWIEVFFIEDVRMLTSPLSNHLGNVDAWTWQVDSLTDMYLSSVTYNYINPTTQVGPPCGWG